MALSVATLGQILIRILNGAGRNVAAAVIIVIAYTVNIAVNLLTSYLPWAHDSGTLLLGLGETARGIVLLAGVVFALNSRRKLLFLIFLANLPAALMVIPGWQIHQEFTATLPRLTAAGAAYLGASSWQCRPVALRHLRACVA
ncbi:MAG: hypothetical protein ABWY14_02895, partial [Tardiphaga sp.]